MLREARVPVAGFVTREVREGRQRTGFRIATTTGEEGILAQVPGQILAILVGLDV